MTHPWTEAFEATAVRCGLCHDQCVSACPVVESSRTQQAYPSRLATLARLLERGELEPSPAAMHALQHCIHCYACTANCVYLDQPVDVTPLVRRARASLVERGFATEAARLLLDRVTRLGNPYGDIQDPLEALIRETPGEMSPGGTLAGCTLVLPDAYGLLFDRGASVSAVKLLGRLGFPQVTISRTAYLGWELWQYGYPLQAARIAQTLQEEIQLVQPSTIITLSPASAYLLRQVYPREMAFECACRVYTMPEAVLEKTRLDPPPPQPRGEKIYLVLTYAESCQLNSLAAREVLVQGGVNLAGFPAQPYHRISFTESQCLDIDPDPGHYQVQRMAARAKSERADGIVCTGTQAVRAFREADPSLRVFDWASYVLNRINLPFSNSLYGSNRK